MVNVCGRHSRLPTSSINYFYCCCRRRRTLKGEVINKLDDIVEIVTVNAITVAAPPEINVPHPIIKRRQRPIETTIPTIPVPAVVDAVTLTEVVDAVTTSTLAAQQPSILVITADVPIIQNVAHENETDETDGNFNPRRCLEPELESEAKNTTTITTSTTTAASISPYTQPPPSSPPHHHLPSLNTTTNIISSSPSSPPRRERERAPVTPRSSVGSHLRLAIGDARTHARVTNAQPCRIQAIKERKGSSSGGGDL